MRILLGFCAGLLVACGAQQDASAPASEDSVAGEDGAAEFGQENRGPGSDSVADFIEAAPGAGEEAAGGAGNLPQPAAARFDRDLAIELPAGLYEDDDAFDFQLRLAIARGRALWALELYRARGAVSRAAEQRAILGADAATVFANRNGPEDASLRDAIADFEDSLVRRASPTEVETTYIALATAADGTVAPISASQALRLAAIVLELAAERYRRAEETSIAYGDSFGLGLTALETVMKAEAGGALAAQSLEDAQTLLIELRDLWPDIVAPSAPPAAWEAGAARLRAAAARIGGNADAIANAE